ncbi:RVP_2 domain-containing protein [Gossypium australe]|uniref:RVP_2 domain-containing protein n=1 Tax=Gossypium australe TaxID=47621 RepID=A0A5B6WYX3_9ROSI|nr:RVP_2 domain-containing protein [Gossypium australe]
MVEKDRPQNVKSSHMSTRGRPQRNVGNVNGSRGATNDSTGRSEARAPTLFALTKKRHHQMLSPKLPVEITEFMVKVSNPLGKYVLVDKVCKNCPLMTRGYYFPAGLILLPFDKFNMILGMDWLTLHDAVVNCRRKIIELKCRNNEIL